VIIIKQPLLFYRTGRCFDHRTTLLESVAAIEMMFNERTFFYEKDLKNNERRDSSLTSNINRGIEIVATYSTSLL